MPPDGNRRQTDPQGNTRRFTAPTGPVVHIPTERWRATLTRFVFWMLAAATLLNFNELYNKAIGPGWGITIGVAMCCLLLLFTARVPLRESLGAPGWLYIGALLSYLLIGSVVAMFVGLSAPAFNYSLPGRTIVGALVVVASATGATVLLRRYGVDSLMLGVAILLGAMCCLTLSTPLMQVHVYANMDEIWRYRPRWSGPFMDANAAGIAACNAAALGFALLANRPSRRAGFLLLILGAAATVVTYSRTAIIALAMVTAYFLLTSAFLRGRSFGSFGRARLWLVSGLAAVGVLAFFMNIEHLPFAYPIERVARYFNPSGWELSAKRSIVFVLGVSKVADAPFLGNGLFALSTMEAAPLCRGGKPCSAHNTFLQFWGEAGLLPLLLLVGALLALARARFRLRRHYAIDAVVGWLIVFVIGCMALNDVAITLWCAFLFGVSCALVAGQALAQRAVAPPSNGSVPGGAASGTAAVMS